MQPYVAFTLLIVLALLLLIFSVTTVFEFAESVSNYQQETPTSER